MAINFTEAYRLVEKRDLKKKSHLLLLLLLLLLSRFSHV